VLLVLLASSACARSAEQRGDGRDAEMTTGPVTTYVNARWLVGDAFVHGSRSAAAGRFVASRAGDPGRTVDLGGAWVVPAFGDAHTHNLDGDTSTLAAYRREGVAYVQVLTNTRGGRVRVAPALEGPGTIDAVYANGAITSTYGHPMLAYEPRAMGLDWTALRDRREDICASRLREREAYWFVDDLAALDREWPTIIAQHPDVLKIMLLHADSHPENPGCEHLGRIGLAPAIAAEVVRRAHDAGLRVWAHVETANDFAAAVDIGVDGIAHLPGYAFRTIERGETAEPYLLDAETARRASARGVVVTPTVSLISSYADDDTALVAATRALQRENLALLRRHGVPMVIGSDWYGRTAWDEVEALADVGLWTPTELLIAWSRTTPRAIFPERRVGALEPGAEATFVGLACDPGANLRCLRDIVVRVTDGVTLPEPASPEGGA
jgi:imidazolonepropionase-like amidohydrolase